MATIDTASQVSRVRAPTPEGARRTVSQVRTHSTPGRASRAGSRRIPAPALRGAGVLIAVVALTIPAYLTLHDAPTTSGVIAGATAYGVAALLSGVLAASTWRLMRAHALSSALAGVIALLAAAALQLYAALTLTWDGEVILSRVEVPLAAAQMLLGLHLIVMAVATVRLRSAPVFPAGLGLSGIAVLVAVFPPTWYPEMGDALLALSLGQLTLMAWFLTHRFGSQAPEPSPRKLVRRAHHGASEYTPRRPTVTTPEVIPTERHRANARAATRLSALPPDRYPQADIVAR